MDLDALNAARAAATAGPWPRDFVMFLTRMGLTPADAALIVAAVNALPALLADARKYRALREAVDDLRAALAPQAEEAS